MVSCVKFGQTPENRIFGQIFSHAQSALGPSESTLRHPKTASKPWLGTIAVSH